MGTAAAQPPLVVVSVEGLDVPARSHVLAALRDRLGLADLGERHAGRAALAPALTRLRALARLPAGRPARVLCAGPWLLPAEPDPELRRLRADLVGAVARRLRLAVDDCVHVMVMLDASPHEAFEHADRAADLRALQAAQAALDAEPAHPAGGGRCWATPFAVRSERIACPPFAADNPQTLAEVLDLATDACRRMLGEA
jgi:hypothetical protein